MTRYKLSAAATADLAGIRDYSAQSWGEARASTYLRDLRHRLRWLAAAPRRGKHRDDLMTGLLSYPQSSHVIYYRIGREEIEIVRVLHRRMDPVRHVGSK